MNYVRAAALLLLLGAALLATASACGGDDGSADPDPTNPPATSASSPAATADDDGSGDDDDGDGDDASTITLIAKDTLWDKSKLEAKAGVVTFIVDNQDGGIIHNLHIYKGTDNTGDDVGQTELEAGPVKQTLTVTLEAGTYFYVCDVHPATMASTIEVEDA